MSCYCGEDYHETYYDDKDQKHRIFNKPGYLFEPPPCCIFHHNQRITNFCVNLDCFMPLCPQCVEDHLDLHRLKNDNSDSYIKTFEHVRICSVESLKGFLDNLKSQKRDLERIGFSPEALKVQLMKDLEISKGKVIAVVEGVFAEMHKQLESELFQVTGFFNMNENMNDINKRLYELHKALETIQSGGQKALKQMILLNNNRV